MADPAGPGPDATLAEALERFLDDLGRIGASGPAGRTPAPDRRAERGEEADDRDAPVAPDAAELMARFAALAEDAAVWCSARAGQPGPGLVASLLTLPLPRPGEAAASPGDRTTDDEAPDPLRELGEQVTLAWLASAAQLQARISRLSAPRYQALRSLSESTQDPGHGADRGEILRHALDELRAWVRELGEAPGIEARTLELRLSELAADLGLEEAPAAPDRSRRARVVE